MALASAEAGGVEALASEAGQSGGSGGDATAKRAFDEMSTMRKVAGAESRAAVRAQ